MGGTPGDVAAAPNAALAPLVADGLLHAADVQVTQRLCALAGEDRPAVLRAVGLAVRAPREGSVCVDVRRLGEELADLPGMPAAGDMNALLASCGDLVAVGPDAPRRPLRLVDDRLYLERYWADEAQVAHDLRRRAADIRADRAWSVPPPPPGVDPDQWAAATDAAVNALTVVAGGPGTGKTTTIVGMLALLDHMAGGVDPRAIAIAAPTGKAAARVKEAIAEGIARMSLPAGAAARLGAIETSTVHRLLGRARGAQTRFRHHRGNPLPHQVVIIDEASMLSLSLLARLLEAVSDSATLVLVGDPDQLTSVEAGSILGDIVACAEAERARAEVAPGQQTALFGTDHHASWLAGSVHVLRRGHRFGGAIAQLADAVRRGDGAATLAVLRGGDDAVCWIPVDAASATPAHLTPIREAAVAAGTTVVERAVADDADGSLERLGEFRLLCAHRRGPYGAEWWGDRVAGWLGMPTGEGVRWLPGMPVMVVENDAAVGLHNGDVGVTMLRDGHPVAVFAGARGLVQVGRHRLGAVVPVHAMTVHKSQGSQFRQVAVVAPPVASRVASRELFYTAITRAQERVIVVGDEAQILAQVERPIERASGLRSALAEGW